MADTITSNLALTLPEVGASADTWGTKINNDLLAIDNLFPSGDLPVANGGTGASTAADARTNLGVAIGTDVPSPTGTGASGTWSISIDGNAATASTANNISNSGGWNVTPSGGVLYFSFNGVNVAKLDSSGNFTSLANVTAYGTI